MSETEHEPDDAEHEPDADTGDDADDAEQHEHEGAEPEHEPEPAAPEAQAAPVGERELRAIRKKLDTERQKHEERLSTILGPAWTDVAACPFCYEGLQGYVIPQDGQHLRDDQREAAQMFLGGGMAPKLRPAEGVKMCERCDGYGDLEYPTRKPHVAVQACPVCAGQGYVPDAAEAPASQPYIQLAPQTASSAAPAGQPCPHCGAPNSLGVPHWCAPNAALGG